MDKPKWTEATEWKLKKTEFLQLNFGKYMTILVYSQNKTSTGPKHFPSIGLQRYILSRYDTFLDTNATIRYITYVK